MSRRMAMLSEYPEAKSVLSHCLFINQPISTNRLGGVTVEREGADKPVCVAESIALSYP
ncbi:MAG: hypothetical protein RLZZ126_778 [Pseudomonadota bacterium]|jgi:hypothetical protein